MLLRAAVFLLILRATVLFSYCNKYPHETTRSSCRQTGLGREVPRVLLNAKWFRLGDACMGRRKKPRLLYNVLDAAKTYIGVLQVYRLKRACRPRFAPWL